MCCSRQNGIVVDVIRMSARCEKSPNNGIPFDVITCAGKWCWDVIWQANMANRKINFACSVWWAARAHPLITSNESKYICVSGARSTWAKCSAKWRKCHVRDDRQTSYTCGIWMEEEDDETVARWNIYARSSTLQWTRNTEQKVMKRHKVLRVSCSGYLISSSNFVPFTRFPLPAFRVYWFVRRRPCSRRTIPFLCRMVFYSWQQRKTFDMQTAKRKRMNQHRT